VKLFYFRDKSGISNFGDALNPWMWPRLLPDAFDEDAATQFLSIGTLLNDRLPAAPRTVVFGAGVGYCELPRPDHSWTVYCVRGPLSARALGLSADAGVTDPAALIRRLRPPRRTTGARGHAFMPHWQSEVDGWRRICEVNGLAFIDPRWPPDRVLDALDRTDRLITEAMHGAIVADALRIPWVPVRTSANINSFKWEDWCASVSLVYRPHRLPPIWPAAPGGGLPQRLRRQAKLVIAGRALANVAKRARPILSRDNVLEDRICELEARLEQLRIREAVPRVRLRAGRTAPKARRDHVVRAKE
jgi:succinoglycan biosynthesis protein ExoV